jgi:hypothetical protein
VRRVGTTARTPWMYSRESQKLVVTKAPSAGGACSTPKNAKSARASDGCAILSHKGTRQVVNFCRAERVQTLYVGDATGRRSRKAGTGPGLRCGFHGHRDIVGSMNMHPIAFGSRIGYPSSLTYPWPGPLRDRRQDKEPSPGGTRVVRPDAGRWEGQPA